MPMQELGFPVGASTIRALINNVNYPLLLDTDTFDRAGEDGDIPILPLCRGDEFIASLEGQWKKGWDANMDADQAFTAIIVSGTLEFEGEADVAGTAGNGWINGHHIIPLLDAIELNFTMQVPVDDTGATPARDIQFDFFLRKQKAVDVPTTDNDYLQWSINVDEAGLLISIFREIGGASTTLFDGSTYDDTTARATGDLEGLVWRVVIHDGIAGASSPSDVRHMHVYLKQKDTITNAEGETENELSTSPYDISGLTFLSAYPAYRIYSQNTTYFDSGNEAKSTYLRVDYPLFHLAYDIAEADRGKGNLELWDNRGSATESDWQLVQDPDHEFGTNDVILQGGLVRVYVDRLVQYGLNFLYWTGAAWAEPVDRLYLTLVTDAQDLSYPILRSVEQVSPEKMAVIIRLMDSSTVNEDYYADVRVTLERGKRVAKFELLEVYPIQDVRVWFLDSTTIRFGYVQDDAVGDDDVNITGNNTTLTDNFLVAFDESLTWLAGVFTNQKPAGGNARFQASDGGDLALEDIDSPELLTSTFWTFIVPFSLAANLFEEAEDATLGGGATTPGNDPNASGAGNNYVLLNAQNETVDYSFVAGTALPEGRYLAVFRALDDNQVADDFEMSVINSTDGDYRNEEHADVHITLTASYAYSGIIFDITAQDVTDGDTIRVRAKKDTAGANNIRVDYFLLIPLGDGADMPQDFAHATMREFTKPRRIIER